MTNKCTSIAGRWPCQCLGAMPCALPDATCSGLHLMPLDDAIRQVLAPCCSYVVGGITIAFNRLMRWRCCRCCHRSLPPPELPSPLLIGCSIYYLVRGGDGVGKRGSGVGRRNRGSGCGGGESDNASTQWQGQATVAETENNQPRRG